MLNSVIITDLSEARSLSFQEKKENVWISVVDQEDKNKIRTIKNNFANKGVRHFVQYFYDWSDEDQDNYIVRNIEEEGPRLQHVNNIISFLKPFIESDKVCNLGVNCFAGISRSTAVGIIAWVLQGKTPSDALDEIKRVRPQAWPNLRILRFASEILKQDLHTPVKEWKQLQVGHIFYDPKTAWNM